MQRLSNYHVNGSKTLLRSAWNRFYTTLPSILERGNRKRLVLVRSESLGEFVNTFTADYKYSRWNRDNLRQQIPRQISLKRKIFSEFFIALLKSTLNFEYFE